MFTLNGKDMKYNHKWKIFNKKAISIVKSKKMTLKNNYYSTNRLKSLE